jgi:uncharacterized surface protein with fasciclin (FAS1) repeats
MGRLLQSFLLLFAICILLVNCRKKQWDEYYGRPEGLEPPIYQQLQTKGNFTQLLALIDKSGYKSTLSNAGYWTLFAPNDDAFITYYKDKGISGIDEIDEKTAQAMVQYMLVYNAFNKDRLDDYQSVTGWIPGTSFKRRTAYYTGFYSDILNGDKITAVASNRNGNFFAPTDNNNKYIPYFIDDFFTTNNLSAADYNYFYPTTTYTGFNVTDARVVTKDITAENGVIHEIDKVITPLPSIDQYLQGKPEYSEFKKLFDKYTVLFATQADVTRKYQVLTGSGDQVYVKLYHNALAFSPNNENFLKMQDNDGQQDGWTLFAPKNDVLKSYMDSVLLENYGVIEKVPPQVIYDFLNAHMWQSTVWPSKFKTTGNFQGEEARFDANADVIDRKFLSNGIFYGTNKVQQANIFSTIYTRAYLNPKYSLMTRLLDIELKPIVTNPKIRFTMFMLSDSVLLKAGYDFDVATNRWKYTTPAGIVSDAEIARQRLLRILNLSVIYTPNNELNNLSGADIIETYGGEYIKFNNGTVVAAGNEDANKTVIIDSFKNSSNGRVYYTNGILQFTELPIGKHIEKLATTNPDDFNSFWQYLKNSTAYTAGTGDIVGTQAGAFYTLFIPTNAAITQAVNDGLLPANFNPALQSEKNLVRDFIQYHVLNKRTIVTNTRENSLETETLFKNPNGETLKINVFANPMYLTDEAGRRSNVIVNKSNNLSARCVIHSIDSYLKYY